MTDLSKTAQRVLDRIVTNTPCTSAWILADDLKLQRKTVDRILAALVAAGRIELSAAYDYDDGTPAPRYYEVTCAEQRDRIDDAEFRRHFPVRTP
jgi:predicted transcriptional regulator